VAQQIPTLGYGPGGSVAFIVRLGFNGAEATPTVTAPPTRVRTTERPSAAAPITTERDA
jgi:hypothetical protein